MKDRCHTLGPELPTFFLGGGGAFFFSLSA
jgi:hypothetical protein